MNAVKEWMAAEGIKTQTAAAERLELLLPHFNQLLNGKRTPSAKLAARIEKLTGGMVPMQSWFE